jgi:hypothetical protein
VQAGVTVQVIQQGTNPVDDSANQGVGFTAYIIRVLTDNGASVVSIDAGGTSSPGTGLTNGIFGQLLQRWDIVSSKLVPTPVESDTFTTSGAYSIDSHYLVPDASRNDVAPGPSEDNETAVHPPGAPPNLSVLGGQFGYKYGFGTKLQATFGLSADVQSPSIDLAYVVLPTGQVGAFAFDVSTSDSATKFHLAGVVPEPGSLGILCAAAGLLLRRRR